MVFTSFQVLPGVAGKMPLHLVASERAKNTTLVLNYFLILRLYLFLRRLSPGLVFFVIALPAVPFPAREFHPGVASLSLCFIAMSYLRLQSAIRLSRCRRGGSVFIPSSAGTRERQKYAGKQRFSKFLIFCASCKTSPLASR